MKFLINGSDAIGNTILAIPMAKMLKEKFPESHITFLVTARSYDLFKNIPYVDSVKIYHRKTRFYFKIKEIVSIFREVKPTHYFYVSGGYLPNFIAWLFRTSFRGGHKSKWHTYLFLNYGIRQKRSMVTMHEMEFNLNLLSALGIKYFSKNLDNYLPELHLNDNEVEIEFEIIKKYLSDNKLSFEDRKIVIVHPGLSTSTLNWSSRNYGRFILKLNQKFPGKFFFIVSHTNSDEKHLVGIRDILNREENKKLVTENVHFFNGAKLGLRNYLCLISKASLFVGPSTGTTHIAAALNIPVVGIYSPIKIQSALRWRPLAKKNDKIKLAVPDVICGENRECALKACPYYECMAKIEVEDVVKQSISIMDL